MGRRVLFGILFGIAVYLAIVLWIDLDDLRQAAQGIALWPIPAAMGLSFGNYLLRFVKWERYRKLLGVELSLGTSFLIYLSGFSMGVTPGKMGEVLKSWMIRKVTGMRIHQSAPIVIAERLTDLLGYLILMAVGGLVSHPELAWVFWTTLAVCVAIVFCCGSESVARWTIAGLARLPYGERIAPRAEGAFLSSRILLAPREILPPTFISVLSWGLECTGFWLIANAFVPEPVSFLFAVFAYATGALVGALVLIAPGGLGVTEWSLGALLRAEYQAIAGLSLDLARSKAAGAVLLTRAATLWFGVLVGGLALLVFQKRYGEIDFGEAGGGSSV